MNSSIAWLRACLIIAIAGAALSSCSVSTDGPAISGASHGSLASPNACDWYYKKPMGWNYTYSNVERIFNSNGTVATTLTGAPDYVHTMGPDGYAPNGDTVFRYQITYRVLSSYAAKRQEGIDMWYVPSTKSHSSNGAFVDATATSDPSDVDGAVLMLKRPRPVSTDTILAGVAGRVRSMTDDFTNNGTYTWVIDTLWTSAHLDTVFIWEKFTAGGPLQKSRCIFLRDFKNDDTWIYDLTGTSSSTTYVVVQDKSTSITVPNGTYSNAAKFRIKTNEVDDKDFNREFKWFAPGVGLVCQWDWWFVTTDGDSFVKHDFTRSLTSLTHD